MDDAERGSPVSIRIASEVHDLIPARLRQILSPLYFRYQSMNADRLHEPPTHSRAAIDESPDHLLVIVIDALRPDHVPELPLQFSSAISPSTWTFPSVTSLHTGQYPHEHGAVAHTHPNDDEYALPRQAIADTTLPAEFEAAGYDTYCGCAFLIPFLAIRGWYQNHRVYRDTDAKEILSDYLQWRDGRNRTFSYLHLGDLHTPIQPPARYLRTRGVPLDKGENLQRCTIFDGCDDCQHYRRTRLNLYDAAYDYVEDQLAALVEHVSEDTLVVVTGDHGEGFWEHADVDQLMTDSRPNYGGGHGGTPFDMIARVPVGLSVPDDGLSLQSGGWASLRDLGVTLLESTVGDPVFPGRSWHSSTPSDSIAICEATRFGVERKAAYQAGNKVIRSETDDVTLTARIKRNKPGEEFCELSDEVTDTLLAALPDAWDDFDTKAETTDPVLDERLEALGYKS